MRAVCLHTREGEHADACFTGSSADAGQVPDVAPGTCEKTNTKLFIGLNISYMSFSK